MSPLNVIKSIASTRSEVKRGCELAISRHSAERVIKLTLDFTILVLAENSLHKREDLGQLIYIVKSRDVLNFLRRYSGVDGVSAGDLNDISANLPTNAAGLNHSGRSINTSAKANVRYKAAGSVNSKLIVLHVSSEDILKNNSLSGISCILRVYNNLISKNTVDLAVGRSKLDSYRHPEAVFAICIYSSTGLGVDITILEIYTVNLNSGDVSIDREVILLSCTDSCKNIGSAFHLRKSHIDRSKGCSRSDCIVNLILLLEHINLFTSGSNENSLLHRHGELRLTCNELGNSTLVEDVVHHDILMKREGHADYRVHGAHVSVLEHCLFIILELCYSHVLSVLAQCCCMCRINLIELGRIKGILNIEVFQGIASRTDLKCLEGLSIQIYAFCKNAVSALLEALSKRVDRISLIASAQGCGIFAITNNRHIKCSFLLSLIKLRYEICRAMRTIFLP